MVPDLRTVLGASAALFMLAGTAVFFGIGLEGMAGVDVPGLTVGETEEPEQESDLGPRTASFRVSSEWVMANRTRDMLREDWMARMNGSERPESYCLRTRSYGPEGAAIYEPIDQAFAERSEPDAVTEEICAGTHPVVLRPSPDSCTPVGRDYWMMGHIGIDAFIVQCAPDAFILYTDDELGGQYVPRPGRNATDLSRDGSGNITVTLG